MADFSVRSTNVSETPNSVTPQPGIVDESFASLIGTAGNALLQGLEIDQTVQGNKFKKEYEENLRLEMTPYINLDPNDPEKGKEPLASETAPDESQVRDFASRAEQAMQMGGIGRGQLAATRMEDFLRRKMASNPWYAKRYKAVAGEVNSDYAQLLRTVDMYEQIQLENAKAASKAEATALGKRITRLNELVKSTGLSPYTFAGKPLDEMSWEEMNAFEKVLLKKNGLDVSLDQLREVNQEVRAAEDQGMQRTSHGWAAWNHNVDRLKFSRAETERNVVQNALAAVSEGFANDIALILENLKTGAVTPEQVRAGLAETQQEVDAAVFQLMTRDSQGRPTGVSPEAIKSVQDNVRATMITPIETLMNSEPEIINSTIALSRGRADLNFIRKLPGYDSILRNFRHFGDSPVVQGWLRRATNDVETALSLGLDKEVQQLPSLYDSPLDATAATVSGVVPDNLQGRDAELVVGAGASLLADIARPGSAISQEVQTSPQARLAFSNLVINTAQYYDHLTADARRKTYDRVLGSSAFMNAMKTLPEGTRGATARAAMDILRADIQDIYSYYVSNRKELSFDNDTQRFIAAEGADQGTVRLVSIANQRLDTARNVNAMLPNPLTDEELSFHLFGVEMPKEDETAP